MITIIRSDQPPILMEEMNIFIKKHTFFEPLSTINPTTNVLVIVNVKPRA